LLFQAGLFAGLIFVFVVIAYILLFGRQNSNFKMILLPGGEFSSFGA